VSTEISGAGRQRQSRLTAAVAFEVRLLDLFDRPM